MFGLDPDTIRNIKLAFAKIPDIDKVILYGSRAKGNYHNGSDIDITLIGKNLTLSNSVYPLMDELEELYLPYMFDISVFSAIDNEKLVGHINRAGKVFYQRKKSLPKGWEVKKLGEVCKISTGKSNANQAISNGQYAFFDRSKKTKKSNRYLFDCDALIIPGEGATFFPKHYSGKFDLHQRAYAIFDFDEDTNIGFVEYYLIFDHKYFERVAVGATVKSLRLRHFQELQIPLPPLPEQKRIVAILDQAFTAIAKAKTNAEQNLKNAREVFQSALQTEFVNGKLKIKNGEWEEKKLGDVCEVFTDGNWIESKDQSTEGIRLIQTGNIGFGFYKDKKDKARFISEETFVRLKCTEILPNDLLISRLPDPVGKSCIIPDINSKMITGVDCTIVRTNDNLIPEFLLFYQMSNQYLNDVKLKVTGTTRSRISRKNLGLIEIPLPPLPEQKRIVAILDQAFTAIAKAKANAEQNLKNAHELFQSYLQNVFVNKGDDWEEITIKKLTELITKGSSPKWQGVNYVDKGGIFFLTSKNVGEGELLLNNKKYLEEKFNNIQKTSILKKGDVVTNIVGASIGRTAIFNLDEITNINQAVCLMRCVPKKVYNQYLMYLLNSPFFKNILHDNEVDNARANLSLTFFKNLMIPLPELSKQKKIVDNIKQVSTETKKLETIYQQKINDLDELKKSILRKAFKGKL